MSNHNAAGLLDAIKAKLKLKNDAALCRELSINPALLSKMRNRHLPVGDSTILRLLDREIMPLSEIRQYVPRVEV